MLSILRVINAVVLSRGQQNDQTVRQAREFLTQNRASMIAVFKRNANIGGVPTENIGDLSDLVDNFTLLISACGFLEVSLYPMCLHSALLIVISQHEEKSGMQNKTALNVFS